MNLKNTNLDKVFHHSFSWRDNKTAHMFNFSKVATKQTESPVSEPAPIVRGPPPAAVSKLSVMQDQFVNFEREMEEEARLRRSSEESRLSGAKETLLRLEKTLNAEIKRRVEANKALQEMFESQILAVQEKLETGFDERLDKVDEAIGAISDRLGLIERDFAVERDRYVRDIEDKNALVARDVNGLQTAFENERIVRAEKEAIIVKRLGDMEHKTEERVEGSKAVLDSRVVQIRSEMEEIYRMNASGEGKFEQFVLEEIASLRNCVLLETQGRESADDDLVHALNHYTKALQDALRIINNN